MAKPIINTTTSVLGYKQGQYFEYQPYATNSPTAWAAPNLPGGLAINAATGRITGAGIYPGVYVVGLTATNADGTSDAVAITIGIEESSATLAIPGVEVSLDVNTREITVAGATDDSPGVYGKYRDDLLLLVRLTKGEQILDLPVTGMAISLKEPVDEGPIVIGNQWTKEGSGIGTYYPLRASLDNKKIFDAANDAATENTAFFDAISEIEVLVTNSLHGDGVGGEKLRFTSKDFKTRLALDGAQEE